MWENRRSRAPEYTLTYSMYYRAPLHFPSFRSMECPAALSLRAAKLMQESVIKNISAQFFKKYYNEIKKYIPQDSIERIPYAWNKQSLKDAAEQEFINQYQCLPSCMVFAPETITIAGTKATDLAESKSLCMAVQLGTVIAGKLSRASKCCHVKILLDEPSEGKEAEDGVVCRVVKLRGNTKSPEEFGEESWWVRYVKETMRSFRARRQGQIPGFKSIIVPAKRSRADEPAACTALVVAVYTFLEAITDCYTSNAFEKALTCHLALKRARGSVGLRFADTLVSILGQENTLFLFDARSLCIETCNWPVGQVGLFLIDVEDESTGRLSRSIPIQSRAIATAVHTNTRWYARPIDLSVMESVYPEEVICAVKRLLAQDDGVVEAMNMIREERWKELGEHFWENYRSELKCASTLSSSTTATVEDIISALQTAEGVLGARILSRGYSASVLVLVQRSCWKRFAGTLSRIKSLRHQHYVVKPSIGATTLYAREDRSRSQGRKRPRYYRDKFISKYHLGDGFEYSQEYHSFEPAKSLSLFIPYDAVL